MDREMKARRVGTSLLRMILAIALALLLVPAGAWMQEQAFADDERLIDTEEVAPQVEESTEDAAEEGAAEDAEEETVLVEEESEATEDEEDVTTEEQAEDADQIEASPLSDIVIDDTVNVGMYVALFNSQYVIDRSQTTTLTCSVQLGTDEAWAALPADDRLAPENFIITSTDPSVATAVCTGAIGDVQAGFTITGNAAGTASFTVEYSYKNYKGTASFGPVYVTEKANPVTNIQCTASAWDIKVLRNQSKWEMYTSKCTNLPSFSGKYGGIPRLCVEVEDPTVPPTQNMDDLFDVNVSGSAISGVTLEAEGTDSETHSKWLFRLPLLGDYQLGTSTVTISLKSDPSITTSYTITVEEGNFDLTVKDWECEAGAPYWIETTSHTQGNVLPFIPENYKQYLYWHTDYDEQDAFVTSVTSSDPSVVRIDKESGTSGDPAGGYSLMPLKSGVSSITIADVQGKTYTFKVTVTTKDEDVVESVAIDKTELTLSVLDEGPILLTPIIKKNEDKDVRVTWNTDNWDVASVVSYDEDLPFDKARARVIIHGAGECILTLYSGGKSAICKVVVEAAHMAETTADSDLQAKITLSLAPTEDALQAAAELEDLSLSVKKKPSSVNSGVDSAAGDVRDEGKSVLGVFDIHFVKDDGTEHQWGTDKGLVMDVRILMDDAMKASAKSGSLAMYYVDDAGNRTKMDSWVEGDYLVFRTTHFSYYMLVHDPSAPPSIDDDGSHQGNGDQNRPPVISNGDENDPQTEQVGITRNTGRVLTSNTDLAQTGDDAERPVLPLLLLCVVAGAVVAISLRKVCQER